MFKIATILGVAWRGHLSFQSKLKRSLNDYGYCLGTWNRLEVKAAAYITNAFAIVNK